MRQINRYRLFGIVALFCLLVQILMPRFALAQEGFYLPDTNLRISLSKPYKPPVLNGIKIYQDNPFRFDFMLHHGDQDLESQNLHSESMKLIRYFLAALTIPEEDLWVNLSPFEGNRIITTAFSQTEMGRDLLAQDYVLKQLVSSLMHPDDHLGVSFWDKIYKKIYDQYGTTDMPVNTFNKVWILPDTAEVYEQKDAAFITHSRLKVMLEEDYLATAHESKGEKAGKETNIASQIMREVILPELEKEVNEGSHFSQLRQMYHALILATWFKKNLKNTFLGQTYVAQNKIIGIDIEDKQVREKIYHQYLDAYKKGVYNFVKEDYDPNTQKIIPRKYFLGRSEFWCSFDNFL